MFIITTYIVFINIAMVKDKLHRQRSLINSYIHHTLVFCMKGIFSVIAVTVKTRVCNKLQIMWTKRLILEAQRVLFEIVDGAKILDDLLAKVPILFFAASLWVSDSIRTKQLPNTYMIGWLAIYAHQLFPSFNIFTINFWFMKAY